MLLNLWPQTILMMLTGLLFLAVVMFFGKFCIAISQPCSEQCSLNNKKQIINVCFFFFFAVISVITTYSEYLSSKNNDIDFQ